MSTTAADVREESHLSREEVEQLAHPKRPLRQARSGWSRPTSGMGVIVLYCIIPFYWMIVSSLRLPTEGQSTEFIPSPASIENYKGVFSGTEQLRPLTDQLGHRVWHHDHPHPAVRHRRQRTPSLG